MSIIPIFNKEPFSPAADSDLDFLFRLPETVICATGDQDAIIERPFDITTFRACSEDAEKCLDTIQAAIEQHIHLFDEFTVLSVRGGTAFSGEMCKCHSHGSETTDVRIPVSRYPGALPYDDYYTTDQLKETQTKRSKEKLLVVKGGANTIPHQIQVTNGFQPSGIMPFDGNGKNVSLDIFKHRISSGYSGLVSTTSNVAIAKEFSNFACRANPGIFAGEGYVFMIIAPPGAVSETSVRSCDYASNDENYSAKLFTLGQKHLFSYNKEYDLPGGCDFDDIIAYRKVESGKKFIGPIYIRKSTMAKYPQKTVINACRYLLEQGEAFQFPFILKKTADELFAEIQSYFSSSAMALYYLTLSSDTEDRLKIHKLVCDYLEIAKDTEALIGLCEDESKVETILSIATEEHYNTFVKQAIAKSPVHKGKLFKPALESGNVDILSVIDESDIVEEKLDLSQASPLSLLALLKQPIKFSSLQQLIEDTLKDTKYYALAENVLYQASLDKNPEVLHRLIDLKSWRQDCLADVLLATIKLNDYELCQAVLEKGAIVSAPALLKALQRGFFKIFELLRGKQKEQYRALTYFEKNIFMFELLDSESFHQLPTDQIIQGLTAALTLGVNINAGKDFTGLSPLGKAIQKGYNKEIIQCLLEKGACPYLDIEEIMQLGGNLTDEIKRLLENIKKEYIQSSVSELNNRIKLDNLKQLRGYFTLTGNKDPIIRFERIKEEYHIIPLQDLSISAEDKKIITLLENLLSDLQNKHQALNQKIKLCLADTGCDMIQTIYDGFSEPIIAIHKDFLSGLLTQKYTQEEFIFGLVFNLIFARNLVSDFSDLRLDQASTIDKAAVGMTKNDNAAMQYLRHCIAFKTSHTDDRQQRYLNSDPFEDIIRRSTDSTDFQSRIQALQTYLAVNPDSSNEVKVCSETFLDNSDYSTEALQNLNCAKLFFTDEFNQKFNPVDKINYLISQLPELQIELYPVEYSQYLSPRAAEFLALLRNISIDLSDLNQVAAVDELLNQCFLKKIPYFEVIYLTIAHPEKKLFLDRYYDAKNILPPLGPLKKLYEAYQCFVKAKNSEEAIKYATEIRTLRDSCEELFNSQVWNLRDANFTSSRFFTSELGNYIQWIGFSEPISGDLPLPWNDHVSWAKESKLIANTLWDMGVIGDERLWECFNPQKLVRFIFSDCVVPSMVLKYYTRVPNDDYPFHIMEKIMKYIFLNSKIDDFEQGLSEEQFTEFFDKHSLLLTLSLRLLSQVQKGKWKTINEEKIQAVVERVLEKFSEIALTGSVSEKETVRSFFLGRADGRDIEHLNEALGRYDHYSDLRPNPLFYQFFVEQKFKDKIFDLFTQEEIRTNMERLMIIPNFLYDDKSFDCNRLIKLFELDKTYHALTLACIEELLPAMEKCFQHADSLKAHILSSHVSKNHYSIFSSDAARMFRLVMYKLSTFCNSSEYNFLTLFSWENHALLSGLTTDDLITIYHGCSICGLFSSAEAEKKMADELIKRINDLKGDSAICLETIEKILFVPSIHMQERDVAYRMILNVKLRQVLFSKWSEYMSAIHGQDNGSPEYQEKIVKKLDEVKKKVGHSTATELFERLAEKIEAQQGVSHAIGEMLKRDSKLANSSFLVYIGPAMAKIFNEEKDSSCVINFLTGSLDQTSLKTMSGYLIAHQQHVNLLDLLKKFGLVDSETKKLKESQIQLFLEILYHNFWDSKIESRSFLIERILFKTESYQSIETQKEAFDAAFNFVTKKLFSEADKSGSREDLFCAFLRSYLKCADQYQKSFLLCALMVASQNTGAEAMTIGKKLAVICEQLGPAYIKLAQAIHSHPDTPADIRHDLDHIKGRANPLNRWILWQLIEETVHKETRAQIKRVGKLLGSASYNLALEVEMIDGTTAVLLLLRPNAAEDAKKGFNHLRRALTDCQHQDIKPIQEIGGRVIDQAQALSLAETDHKQGDEQHKIAENLYHDTTITVTVDKQTYSVEIYPAKSITSGAGYRLMKRVEGEEFNSLPNSTAEEKALQKAVAKAIFELELSNIFHGQNFDCDRHGNQLRILFDATTKHITIGLYDFGEMSMTVPTKEDILQLNEIIRTSLWEMFVGKTLNQHVTEHIRRLSQEGKNIDYLLRVQKALLALQDFQKELSQSDLLEVINNICKKPNFIHLELTQALLGAMAAIDLAHSVSGSWHSITNFFAPLFSSANTRSTSSNLHLSP